MLVPTISVGRQTLYFFPNAILVEAGGRVGGIRYGLIDVTVEDAQFIETESVPRDAQKVGQTWRYVNKSGGPDRRFKDNPSIPIVRYEAIHLRSSTGLNELIQVSRIGLGSALANSLQGLAAVQSSATSSAPPPFGLPDNIVRLGVAGASAAALLIATRLHHKTTEPVTAPATAQTVNSKVPPASATPLASRSPADVERPRPVPAASAVSAIERKISTLKITALAGGTRQRVVIDNSPYSVGDVVDGTLGILVHSVDAERGSVTFIDLDGKLHIRSLK